MNYLFFFFNLNCQNFGVSLDVIWSIAATLVATHTEIYLSFFSNWTVNLKPYAYSIWWEARIDQSPVSSNS